MTHLAQRMHALIEPIVGPTGQRIGQILGLRGRICFARGDHEAALPLLELLEGGEAQVPGPEYM